MKTGRRLTTGLTLIEAMIVVAVLAALVAMLLPAIARPKRHNRPMINCRNNLKQIGLSFRQWALDNNDKYPAQVPTNSGGAMELAQQGFVWPILQVMSNELNTPKILVCPEDKER